MPIAPISFWIVILVLMLVILVLQHATQYTSSDVFADLLSDAGLFIIFAAVVIGAVFKLLYYYRGPYGSLYRFWEAF